MLDKHGRKIDYLRVSLTDRCNLRCIYCMPKDGINKLSHEDVMRQEDILIAVNTFAQLGGKKIRYTGGEPLIVKGIEQIIAKTSKIPGIQDISITTNGILLADMLGELQMAGLKRVNISLDTLNSEKYKTITRGGDINKVFQAIEKVLKSGLKPLKINTVLIKGINDDEIDDLIRLTREMPVDVRFIELMPLGEGKKYYQDGFISTERVIFDRPELLPIVSDPKSTAKLYKLKNAKGRVGIITPLSCKFCSSCNKIRLTSLGTVKPCLHATEEFSIKEFINNEIQLLAQLKQLIANKPQQHFLLSEKQSRTNKLMCQIGG